MNQNEPNNALTSADYWQKEFWQIGESEVPDLKIDVHNAEYREWHQYLKRYLPADSHRRLVELGCHPGRYLWYFHTHFGYEVEGIEYVIPACELTERALAAHDVPAKIHAADFFEFTPEAGAYDIVFSQGVVEHFVDVIPVVRRHAELAKPGGYIIIVIPNHAGLNGFILKHLDRKVYDAHNQMSFRDLKEACDQVPELEFVTGGYLSRFNLSPSNLFPWLLQKLPLIVYKILFKLYYYTLLAARILPNTRWLSPNTILIAKKKDSTDSKSGDS